VAEKYDVTMRLAEGQPAVDNVQTYVWACHVLGYTNPDLTLHAAQVRDWYCSEEGLDLRALDADCAALEGALAATEEALARQDAGALAAAWQGDGADASTAFLHRHGEASAAAAAAVRTSADALAALRENLWKAVDDKVTAAIDAAERASDEWLAAAHTVTTGAGDRAAASERIDHEVKPFVDNDIRVGWLTAMRSAMATVGGLYDAATAEVAAEPDAVFDVPGDLGPSWTPPPRGDEAATVPAAATVATPPASSAPSWGASAAPLPPAPAMAVPMPAPLPAAPPASVDPGSTAPAMAAPPSMPSLGGMPDIGSGLSGFGQQLADAFGSLLGSADDTPDAPDIDEPEFDDELDGDAEDDPEEGVDEATVDPDDEAVAEEAPEEPIVEPACEAAATPVEPPPQEELEPAPTPVPEPPIEPAAAPEAPAAETACEIAADELPQVGE
jgi:hypothetical protein